MNYNGLDFLPRCLASLKCSSYSPLELVVVDNNSSDNSLEYLRKEHPDIRLFAFKDNLGFSGAYNAVIPEISADYIVLLNFDVEVEPDWLNQAIGLMEADSSIVAVQPKLKAYQRRDQFEYSGGSGGFIDCYGYPFARGRIFDHIERDDGQYNSTVPIFWASGAAHITRRIAYLEAGGLDDDFFMHMEEMDLCWRHWLYGHKVAAAPEGVVYHWSGAALSAERFWKMYLNHRNGLIMMLKNYSMTSLLKYLPVRLLLDWITVFIMPFKGEPKRSLAVLAAHLSVLVRFPKVLIKRRRVQKKRRVRDADLHHVVIPGSVVSAYYLKKQNTFSQIVESC